MMPVIAPNDMKFVPKRWGWELWICNGDQYCGKILFIKQGHYCSFHYHGEKDEVLHVFQGKISFKYANNKESDICEITLSAGHAFHVEPYQPHQMVALEDTTIIEFSTHHEDADSYRVAANIVRGFPIENRGIPNSDSSGCVEYKECS